MKDRKQEEVVMQCPVFFDTGESFRGVIHRFMRWGLGFLSLLAVSAGLLAETPVVIKTTLGDITVALYRNPFVF